MSVSYSAWDGLTAVLFVVTRMTSFVSLSVGVFKCMRRNRKHSLVYCKMWNQLVLVTCLLLKATSRRIIGFGDTAVEYGKDAFYKCELQNQKGVQQVTWQKRLWDSTIVNVASYSKRFGTRINEPYQGKVILKETSLSSASLVLKNVTFEDESCYICIFNVYPEDSKRQQTCLTVQGISEVNAQVFNSSSRFADGTTTVVFSCSATGKPAPTIRWRFLPNITTFHQTAATTIANNDRTFTTSQNATLYLSESWKGHADCVVQSGGQDEKVERVPFFWDDDLNKMVEEEEPGRELSKRGQTFIVVGVVALVVVMVIAIIVNAQKRHNMFKRSPNQLY